MNNKESYPNYREVQLTKDPSGHCLYTTQCFSPDDEWIVFDTRNDDGGIMGAGEIAMVHTGDGRIVSLYKTRNQGVYGPGVGAASFSPMADRVLFIHGIRNASMEKPYSFTRRTGVAIDTRKPFEPLFMDARTIDPPFVPGALRGGTHAHSWSGDGQWISYTYNDYLLEQLEKKGEAVKDLRTIGVMAPGKRVMVKEDENLENNSGHLFSFLIAEVTETPVPGTDAIEKAFDECWVGRDGYRKPDGSFQKRAIAFQGNLRDAGGRLKTEVFIADIPVDIVTTASAMPVSYDPASRPAVPPGVGVRRLSYTEKGVSSIPRHWLRSTADGGMIGFLAEDDGGLIQLFGISTCAGTEKPRDVKAGEKGNDLRQLTKNAFSICGPFNFSPDGRFVAYIADNSVWITEIADGGSVRITAKADETDKPEGAVIWSNDGSMLCYNRRIRMRRHEKEEKEEKVDNEGNEGNEGKSSSGDGGKGYLQIFLLKRQG